MVHARRGRKNREARRTCSMKFLATTSSNEVARNMLDRNLLPFFRKNGRCRAGRAVPRHVTSRSVLQLCVASGPSGHSTWSDLPVDRSLNLPTTLLFS